MSKEVNIQQEIQQLLNNVNTRYGILNTAVTDLLNDVRQLVVLVIQENEELKKKIEQMETVRKAVQKVNEEKIEKIEEK